MSGMILPGQLSRKLMFAVDAKKGKTIVSAHELKIAFEMPMQVGRKKESFVRKVLSLSKKGSIHLATREIGFENHETSHLYVSSGFRGTLCFFSFCASETTSRHCRLSRSGNYYSITTLFFNFYCQMLTQQTKVRDVVNNLFERLGMLVWRKKSFVACGMTWFLFIYSRPHYPTP